LKTKKYLQTLLAFVICVFFSTSAFGFSFLDPFIDPQDGALDTSHWLVDRKGFLPIPLIITEPAVGFGLGAGLIFFHESKESEEEKPEEKADDDGMLRLPPSISAVFGGYTENDSWLVGGGHFGSWHQDRTRYIGGIGAASLNLKFYGPSESAVSDSTGLKFTIDAFFLLQEILFRIKDTKFFVGGRYLFVGTDNRFRIGETIPGLPPVQLESDDAGLGLVANYDSRDNLFSPNLGYHISLNAIRYDDAFGGDFDYNYLKLSGLSWWKLFPNIVLGTRVDGRFTDGDIPFYAVPFIQLRGIPALRYQGEKVIVGEIEPRWDITYRWSLVGFLGSGWASDSLDGIFGTKARVAYGGGFRYLLARRLGMRAGLDVARGPEETAVYLTVGSDWR
jgi:hypothetical protein